MRVGMIPLASTPALMSKVHVCSLPLSVLSMWVCTAATLRVSSALTALVKFFQVGGICPLNSFKKTLVRA